MKNKAYIVVNKQQEREVLEQLEREGMVWGIINEKPTDFNPRTSYLVSFPYVIFVNDWLSWNWLPYLENEEIVFDGRKEEQMSDKYVVSQEFMNDLKDWKDTLTKHIKPGYFIDFDDLSGLSETVCMWWGDEVSDEESNNRLIAIIRWVNGEDVFKVDKPKKWVVRSKVIDTEGSHLYVNVHTTLGIPDIMTLFGLNNATKFDTKEEAESWANAHQEVIDVVDV